MAPHIEGIVRAAGDEIDPELLRVCMRLNVGASVDHLRHGSRLLEDLVLAGRLVVIGAEYELETGCVHFLEAHE